MERIFVITIVFGITYLMIKSLYPYNIGRYGLVLIISNIFLAGFLILPSPSNPMGLMYQEIIRGIWKAQKHATGNVMAITEQKKTRITMGIKTNQNKKPRGLTVVKQALNNRKPIPIFFALPYKDILNKKGHPILLADDTYADMLNLPGKDLDFLNAEGDKSSNAIIADFHQLLSVYVEDFDIFVSQLPADTRIQQVSWEKKSSK
ncbi:hypothetical protein ACG92U_02570 [Leuconostoc citreum]